MKRLILISVLMVALLSVSAFATVPRVFSVQGKLTDAGGTPISAAVPVVFKVYNVAGGGTALCSLPSMNVDPDTTGIFDAELDLTPCTLDFNSPYWVEIVVNSQTMSPRVKLAASPYSLSSYFSQPVTVNGVVAANGSIYNYREASVYGQTTLESWGLYSPKTIYIEPGAGHNLYIVPNDWSSNLNVRLQGNLCLNGDCRSAWPSSSSLTCASCNGGILEIPTTSDYELRFTGSNGANIHSPSSSMYFLAGSGSGLYFGTNGIDSRVIIDTSGNVKGYGYIHADTSGGNSNLETSSYSIAGTQIGGQTFYAYGSMCVGNSLGNCAGTGGIVITSSGITVNGNTVWHAGNDGSGSGLDADTLDGLNVHTGTNNEANKIVRTDGNGYIQAGWINTPSGEISSGITKIYASGDNYIRYVTPATLVSQLGLWTSGNDGFASGMDADKLDGKHLAGIEIPMAIPSQVADANTNLQTCVNFCDKIGALCSRALIWDDDDDTWFGSSTSGYNCASDIASIKSTFGLGDNGVIYCVCWYNTG